MTNKKLIGISFSDHQIEQRPKDKVECVKRLLHSFNSEKIFFRTEHELPVETTLREHLKPFLSIGFYRDLDGARQLYRRGGWELSSLFNFTSRRKVGYVLFGAIGVGALTEEQERKVSSLGFETIEIKDEYLNSKSIEKLRQTIAQFENRAKKCDLG